MRSHLATEYADTTWLKASTVGGSPARCNWAHSSKTVTTWEGHTGRGGGGGRSHTRISCPTHARGHHAQRGPCSFKAHPRSTKLCGWHRQCPEGMGSGRGRDPTNLASCGGLRLRPLQGGTLLRRQVPVRGSRGLHNGPPRHAHGLRYCMCFVQALLRRGAGSGWVSGGWGIGAKVILATVAGATETFSFPALNEGLRVPTLDTTFWGCWGYNHGETRTGRTRGHRRVVGSEANEQATLKHKTAHLH
jgi:hypothetical protein